MQLGFGEGGGVDIADAVTRLDIAPGAAAGIFEHREAVTRLQRGDGFGIGGGRGAHRRRRRAAAAQQGTRIMGRENLPGEADIGDIVAIGVDRRIEGQRRPGQPEPFIRSGG
jgi:hypothetical protein